MRKAFIIIVMLLSAIVANAQKTKGDLAKDFATGYFHLIVDNESYACFAIDFNENYFEDNGNIWYATFKTSTASERAIKGAQTLIKLFKEDSEAFSLTLFEKYGILIDEDTFVVSEDGESFSCKMSNKYLVP